MVWSIQSRSRLVSVRTALFALLVIGLAAGCGEDPVGPVAAGTYALRGTPHSDLPLTLRASEHGETVLTGGILLLGVAPAGTPSIPGELSLSVYNGPIGGPYAATDAIRISFMAEQDGRRLIMRYPSLEGGRAVPPDTLQVRAGGALIGSVTVPNSATGRLTLVFRLGNVI